MTKLFLSLKTTFSDKLEFRHYRSLSVTNYSSVTKNALTISGMLGSFSDEICFIADILLTKPTATKLFRR